MSKICPSQNPFIYAGMTRPQLNQAFDLVCDPSDWKAPISAQVPESSLGAVIVAIEFFTATTPKVHLVDMTEGQERVYLVESVGYRMGPAGP